MDAFQLLGDLLSSDPQLLVPPSSFPFGIKNRNDFPRKSNSVLPPIWTYFVCHPILIALELAFHTRQLLWREQAQSRGFPI